MRGILRLLLLGLFCAVCGAGGALLAVSELPAAREVLRGAPGPAGPAGPQGEAGQPGAQGEPGAPGRSADLSDLRGSYVVGSFSCPMGTSKAVSDEVVTHVSVTSWPALGGTGTDRIDVGTRTLPLCEIW